MEKLPTELLEKIFLLLRGPDRLSAALVCKQWAEIVSTSRLLKDICLVLRRAALEGAIPTLLHSNRQYTSLKICYAPLNNCHAEFWTRIAEDLVSLRLKRCSLSAEILYTILGECQKLQSLELKGCHSSMMPDDLFQPPEYICVAKVQQSLRNVRHLSVRWCRSVSDESFKQMLTLMPNISSLCLAGSSRIGLSPAVLTLQNVLVCMMKLKQEFVDLDFSGTFITEEALIQIVELYRESLTNLRLDSCDQLTDEAYEAIGECSKLRLLSLNGTSHTEDGNLERILVKNPNLEYLDLGFCQLISSQSLQLIVQLKKLRHLDLAACRGIGIDSLGSLKALTELQHLDLNQTYIEGKAFRQLASLKDLRHLDLSHCVNLDSECFMIICDNFKRLEKLNLGFISTLTDEAGCKFHQMKCLRSLDIMGVGGISDRSLENGIGAPDMKMLRMGDTSLFTDRALVSIAKHHVRLEHLDLEGCVQITDFGLISVVQCLPRLGALILWNCRSLTDQCLHALQDHCPRLQKLNVMSCSMSRDAMKLLEQRRPTIRILR